MESWAIFAEAGIVALFALGWWVLERQGKRLDRIRAEEKARSACDTPSS